MHRDLIFKLFVILSCLAFLNITCAKTKTEGELMSQAEMALKEDNPKAAVKAYKDIIRLHPQSPNLGQVQTLIGIVYLSYNDEEKMKQAWDEVKSIAPDYDLEKGLYDEAQELQNHGKPELAVKIYQNILQFFPESPIKYQAQFLIGFVSSEQLKEYDQARDAFQKVVDQYPNCDLVDDAQFMLKTMGSDSLTPEFEE